jgi:hypothetical protein
MLPVELAIPMFLLRERRLLWIKNDFEELWNIVNSFIFENGKILASVKFQVNKRVKSRE